MNLCSDALTLYNARHDKRQDCTVYERTVIHGISWYSAIKTVSDDKGIKSANQFIIRIPVDADFGNKSFIDPANYASADDVSGLFTMQQGDLMVKGIGPTVLNTPAELHRLNPDNVCTIQGVTDNRRALNGKHWKVVGA